MAGKLPRGKKYRMMMAQLSWNRNELCKQTQIVDDERRIFSSSRHA